MSHHLPAGKSDRELYLELVSNFIQSMSDLESKIENITLKEYDDCISNARELLPRLATLYLRIKQEEQAAYFNNIALHDVNPPVADIASYKAVLSLIERLNHGFNPNR